VKVILVDPMSMPLHPLLTHPHSGQPLRAVCQRADGSYVWPHLGADGENDDADDSDDGDDSDDSDDSDADDDANGDDSDDSGKSKKSAVKTVSREEYEKLKARMAAADKNRSDTQKKLDEYERKGKTELENAQADVKRLTEEKENLSVRFTSMALTNAFLTASAQEKINWVDPEDAQAIGGRGPLKDLEVGEDGSVEGIREAVKALAKSKPHLLRKDEGDDEDETKTKRPPSGNGVGSGKNGKGKARKDGVLSADDLRSRFPALR